MHLDMYEMFTKLIKKSLNNYLCESGNGEELLGAMSLTYLDRVGLIKSRFQVVSSQLLVWDDTVIEYPCECGEGKDTK